MNTKKGDFDPIDPTQLRRRVEEGPVKALLAVRKSKLPATIGIGYHFKVIIRHNDCVELVPLNQ